MTMSAVATASGTRAERSREQRGTPLSPRGRAGVAAAVVAGVALRAGSTSPLWLDEALSVNIADVGLRDLPDALRRDGAPPLYYALLWAWKEVVGDTDHAVRLLSAVFGVATLVLIHRIGTRRGGPLVGAAALVLLATSPFAIRYATEARMYTLVALLAAAGWLALDNALAKPAGAWLAATGACAGLLLLTHYWGFYLVAAAGAALLVAAWTRPARRRRALACAAAMAAGAVLLFAPWLPVFLYQSQHTGTPWGAPPGPVEVAALTLLDLGGGPVPEGIALASVLAALVLLALLGRAVDRYRIELDLRTRPGVRADLAVAAAALLAGVAVGFATGSAWASRYTSITFPIVVLVAAYGVTAFADRRVVAGVLAVASVLGLAGGVRNLVVQRTQAEEVAAAVDAHAVDGDLVVYCPDQLGPDVSRAIGGDGAYEELTFPDLAGPRLVDWVDYSERMRAADPRAFAAEVLARAQGRNIFYVWMPGYRSLEKSCQRINDALGNARPGNRQLVEPDSRYFERQVLWLHPASP